MKQLQRILNSSIKQEQDKTRQNKTEQDKTVLLRTCGALEC